jgi:hypothetical protein
MKGFYLIYIFLGIVICEPLGDRVYKVDGWNNNETIPFKTYSGFLSILGTTKNLHYIYFES